MDRAFQAPASVDIARGHLIGPEPKDPTHVGPLENVRISLLRPAATWTDAMLVRLAGRTDTIPGLGLDGPKAVRNGVRTPKQTALGAIRGPFSCMLGW
jgi:hypothetical protein